MEILKGETEFRNRNPEVPRMDADLGRSPNTRR